jgi:hypothetical protein
MPANSDANAVQPIDNAAAALDVLSLILVELKVISAVLGESSAVDVTALRAAFENEKDEDI